MNRSILFLATVVVSAQVAFAAQADKHAADEAAIRKAVESYVAAFNRGDADSPTSEGRACLRSGCFSLFHRPAHRR